MEPVSGLLGTWADGIIGVPGDTDFFKFEATAGQWIAVVTDTGGDNEDANELDTVITVFDEAGAVQVAQADDAYPYISTDSEIYYHVATTGTYCIRVDEYSNWSGGTALGDPTYTYQVGAYELDFAQFEQLNKDSDPTPTNDTAGTAQTLTAAVVGQGTQVYAQIHGLLDTQSDVDWYKLTTPAAAIAGQVYFTPDSADGYGSTSGPGNVTLLDAAGTTVLARLDYQVESGVALQNYNLSFPLTENTDYLLRVERPAGAGAPGANDFYVFKAVTADQDNEQETEGAAVDGVNDTLATTDGPVAGQVSTDGLTTSYFVGGHMANVGDVDYWEFPANAGEEVALACGSLRSGSGVQGFHAEIRTAADVLVPNATGTEDANTDILWSTGTGASAPPIAITTAGNYYVVLSNSGQDATVTGTYYRCGIHVSTPTP
ncbi:MAG: PPC domain-containing protein [Polyangiaceae bacterium]|nr:PPC domain-containing protein [Polyangiaceae bacterium]